MSNLEGEALIDIHELQPLSRQSVLNKYISFILIF